MWLLRTTSGDPVLEQVLDRDLEPDGDWHLPKVRYAILSHRWEDNEMSFDAIQSGPTLYDTQSGPALYNRSGWFKIDRLCQQAALDGLHYAWADTACIDKRSSAELQEAINSMYRWYAKAEVCYVYLSDVYAENFHETFKESKWFLRAWTLQELIAPPDVLFFDATWHLVGDKQTLSGLIADVTGISIEILLGKKVLQQYSIAQRMSWAARRSATRIEDRAYSLLGMFDVNMPMLYGEGEKSFIRLQEEIIKTSDDQSIFAWSDVQRGQPGLLAPRPDVFLQSGDIEQIQLRYGREPYTMNNRGLSMTMSLAPYLTDTYLASIRCARRNSPRTLMVIFLRRLREDDQYARVSVRGEDLVDMSITFPIDSTQIPRSTRGWTANSINIRQTRVVSLEDELFFDRVYGFHLSKMLLEEDSKGGHRYEVSTKGRWDPEQRTLTVAPGSRNGGNVGGLDIQKQNRKVKQMRLGFDHDFNPVIFVSAGGNYQNENPMTNLLATNTTGWNKIINAENKSFASASSARPGLWALKGDRITGLDVYLSLDMIEFGGASSAQSVGRVRIQRGRLDGALVWDVEIDDLQDTKSRKVREVISMGIGKSRRTNSMPTG
ncbi:hypothetical protein LTR37_010462 [Vermiconidia calcicola]|uniref:Uncharacterized protein n=1 Tax=Vermiconidia calcicola TaxID=1690605 RepID=A0ACC3N689_9PEZI|nr:hypothetical protein LTR37_010462 [Vermiconidia calcicola]